MTPRAMPSWKFTRCRNDLESAIVAPLPANGVSFMANLRGVNGTTGVGVYALN